MKFLISIIFFTSVVFAQTGLSEFDRAMEYYFRGEYFTAAEKFSELSAKPDLDQELFSASLFYRARCLLELNQVEAAEIVLERFTDSHTTSSYRAQALYLLGTLYFTEKEFSDARRALFLLIRDYPESEYLGAAYYFVGESFAKEDRFIDAESFLKEAISLREENPYLDYSIYTLANLYEKQADFENAISYYDELLTYYRSSKLSPYAQLRIGICYSNLEDYESAVLELTNPLLSNLDAEQQTEAQYILAYSFFKQEQFRKAEETFRRILSRIKDKTAKDKIEYGLAWVKFQTGEYEKAFRAFDVLSLTAEGETAEHALFWSGECRRYQGRFSNALKIYEKFLTEYPESSLMPAVLLNLGLIYFNEGELSEADKYLNRVVAFEDVTSKAKAYNALGEIYLREGKFRTARNYFQQVDRLRKVPQPLINRAILGTGAANFYLGNYMEVIEGLSGLALNYDRFEKQKVSYFLAEAYYAQGDYSSAIRYYSNIDISNKELGADALYGKAYSYFNMKNYPDAAYYFGEFTKQFKDNPNFLDAWLRMGDSYYGTKNFERAAKIYNEIFERYGNKIRSDFAYYQYAQALFKSGASNKAVTVSKKLQRRFPRSQYADDVQYLIGWIYFQKNDYRRAIENYEELIDRFPASPFQPVMLASIGDAYYNLGEYDISISYYSEIFDRYPSTQFVFDAITGIEYCYIAKDEPEKAANFIDQFVIRNPQNKFAEEVFFKKGEIFYSAGRYDRAKLAYKEFIATYPKSEFIPKAYYWIAKSAELEGNNEESEYNYSILVDNYLYSESGISGALELSEIYIQRGEYNFALELINRALAAAPDSKNTPELLYEKGRIQKLLGNIDDAFESFAKISRSYIGTIFAAKSNLQLAILQLENKNYQEAERLLMELSETRMDDIGAQAQFLYGQALFDQGKIVDAISAFVRVRTIYSTYDEWFTRSLLKLGDCYILLKDKKRARDMFRAVIKRHKNDDFGKEAKSKLKKI